MSFKSRRPLTNRLIPGNARLHFLYDSESLIKSSDAILYDRKVMSKSTVYAFEG